MTCLIRSNVPNVSKISYSSFRYNWCLRWILCKKRKGGEWVNPGIYKRCFVKFSCSGVTFPTPFSDCESEPVSKDLLCKFQFTPYYCRHIADAIMDNAFESSKNVSFSFSICIPSVISLLSKDSTSILLCSMWSFTGFYGLYFFFSDIQVAFPPRIFLI